MKDESICEYCGANCQGGAAHFARVEAGERFKMFYFGCSGAAGHYMFCTSPARTLDERRQLSGFTKRNPWGYGIDGGLCPKGKEQVQGRALVHHRDGWTALSFWDRSADNRMGSSSTFLAEGEFDFVQMCALAAKCWPRIWARFGFEIVDAAAAFAQLPPRAEAQQD